jgi:hypothetical protein
MPKLQTSLASEYLFSAKHSGAYFIVRMIKENCKKLSLTINSIFTIHRRGPNPLVVKRESSAPRSWAIPKSE